MDILGVVLICYGKGSYLTLVYFCSLGNIFQTFQKIIRIILNSQNNSYSFCSNCSRHFWRYVFKCVFIPVWEHYSSTYLKQCVTSFVCVSIREAFKTKYDKTELRSIFGIITGEKLKHLRMSQKLS